MQRKNSPKAEKLQFCVNGKNKSACMDEREYKSAYKSINPTRCVFEKAINSRVCNCSRSVRFNLADREGVSCNSGAAQARCQQVLQTLRENSRFVLQVNAVEERLSHNADIKIQNGGMKGIANLIDANDVDERDIDTLLDNVIQQYKSIETLPYQAVVREISSYQVRRRRKNDL